MNNNFNIVNNKLIDDFFNNAIKESFPSLIISENKNLDKEINIINEMFLNLKEEIKKIPPQNDGYTLGSKAFENVFTRETKNIAEYIKTRINEPNFIYELSPTLHEVISLSEKTSLSIILKTYENSKELNKKEQNSKTVIFDGLEFLKNRFLKKSESSTDIKDEIWEQLSKEALNKLLNDFEFKSITIAGKRSWREIYSWANDTYKAIKEAQETIGLSPKSAGINKTLNISYSPDTLFRKHSHGSMLVQEHSNSIILTQQPHNLQKCTWQHEYTHALDNRSSIAYLKDIGIYSRLEHENSFTSVTEMSRSLFDLNLAKSENSHIQQAQIWTSEAMSMIINGKNNQDFKDYQQNAETKFLTDMSKYLVISLLPEQEKTWLKIPQEEQNAILNNLSVKDFTQYISKTLYQKGDKFLNDNASNHEEITIITEHIRNVSSVILPLINIETNSFVDKSIKTIENNKVQFTNDLKSYLNKHSYSFDGNRTYFPTSDSVKQASSEAILNTKSYWIMPIEILARASENLQQPLLLGTSEFHKNENNESKYLIPQLNREERIILLNSIQNMAKSIGLEVLKAPEDVKSVEKELNHIESLNFENIPLEQLKSNSTASGDENIAKTLLNVARLRASTHERSKNKP